MSGRKSIWLIIIILFVAVTTFGADKPVVDCKMSRITVPLAEYNGKVTCAASFMYGAYVDNPTDQDDFLNSDDITEKFDALPEEERWQYPEYAVIKHFHEWKADNKEGILSCCESGYSREKEASTYKPMTEKEMSFWQPFTRVVFFDKGYFGPYARIYWLASEVSESGSTKNCRGIAGFCYLKRVGNRYMLTHEINNLNIFDPVAAAYGARTLMKRENIPLNPDVSGMDWFAMDVDTASPPENKKWLTVFSTDRISDVPPSFSENYLKVYVKAEPVNIELNAGKKHEGNLSEEMRFIESAVTATQIGTEAEILSKWSEKQKERISKDIKRIKDANERPKMRQSVYNFGPAPTVVALLRTSAGTVLYYKEKRFEPPEWVKKHTITPTQNEIYSVGLQEEQGDYTLFNASSKGELNVLTNQMLRDAINKLYAQ